MDAPNNLFTKISVFLVFAVPVASIILHLALKPRFWTPCLVVLGISASALTIGEYVHSQSILIALRNGVVFGIFFSFFAVIIGLVVRLFFRREYAEDLERQMRAPTWRLRNRVLSVVAGVFGVLFLTMSWTVLKDFELKGTILAACSFYLAYKYWKSRAGVPSASEWILQGDPPSNAPELSNNTAETDARKSGARGSP